MNKEEIDFYALKYRKNYKITTIITSIFIFIIGAIVLSIGLILVFNNEKILFFIIGIIMSIVALIDIGLGILFINNSFKNIKSLPDKICAKRYLEVRGK